jgi:hypothetical protein
VCETEQLGIGAAVGAIDEGAMSADSAKSHLKFPADTLMMMTGGAVRAAAEIDAMAGRR